LVSSQYINLEEVGSFANTGFAIGTTSPGGNACEGSLFVLSFVAGEPTRIDGPLDTCGPLDRKIENNRIIVETQASPSRDGFRWTWTSNGFGPAEALKFAAASGKGWSALRSRSIQHPSELLQHAEFSAQLAKQLGQARYPSLARLLSGPGDVQYDSNVMIAEACQAHSCDDTSVLIAIDIATQKMGIALKDKLNPLSVTPKDSDWPETAKAYLRGWRAKWRN
jgi:hypothetical protein